jgi:phage tail sheath protein FI
MNTSNQEKLQSAIDLIIAKSGSTQAAVIVIKSKKANGLFAVTSNYEHGVFVHCNSEQGGLLVGSVN